MTLVLTRDIYTSEFTLGYLFADELKLATVERPWIPNPAGPGGMPQKSCVPEGVYTLEPHSSDKFSDVYILSNPDLGVYKYDTVGHVGRSAILIHVGNTSADVIGCIAVGTKRAEKGVSFSRDAMEQLRQVLGKEKHTLSIIDARAK